MNIILTVIVLGVWAQFCVVLTVKNATEGFMKLSLWVAIGGSFLAVGASVWSSQFPG